MCINVIIYEGFYIDLWYNTLKVRRETMLDNEPNPFCDQFRQVSNYSNWLAQVLDIRFLGVSMKVKWGSVTRGQINNPYSDISIFI